MITAVVIAVAAAGGVAAAVCALLLHTVGLPALLVLATAHLVGGVTIVLLLLGVATFNGRADPLSPTPDREQQGRVSR